MRFTFTLAGLRHISATVAAIIAVSQPVFAEPFTSGDFSYEINDAGDGVIVTGYSGEATEIVIPDMVKNGSKNYPVTAIGENAFFACDITGVSFGANVREIAQQGFAHCSNLTSVIFNSALETVGTDAFYNCSSLSINEWPANLKSIGNYACRGTATSGVVTYPAAIVEIGLAPYRACAVTEFVIPESNTKYATVDGVLFNKDMSVLESYPSGKDNTSYTVPSTVRKIAQDGMRNNVGLTSVQLPEGLEYIGVMAFAADKLQTLHIPASVNYIGGAAIFYNFGLTTITVASGNQHFEVNDGFLIAKEGNKIIGSVKKTGKLIIPEGVRAIGDYVFYGCSDLTSATFPASLKSTGTAAFYYCQGLETLDLGTGVEEIGIMCFQNCSSLKNVDFPPQLKVLRYQAFSDCSSLKEAILNDGLEIIEQCVFFTSGVEKVRIPPSVQSFGYSIFYGCPNLKEAVLEEGITEIPEQMFNYDSSLTKISLPSTLKSIGQAALYSTGLTSLDLPEGLEFIGNMALYGSQLEEITLPNSVTELAPFAFAWCPNLRKVVCGSGLKKISDHVFHVMPALEQIVLNEGLESIGEFGISYCDPMKKLVLPSTLKEIGSCAFDGNALEHVVTHSVEPQSIEENTFADANGEPIYDTCILSVPEGRENAYRQAPVWGLFKVIRDDASGLDGNLQDLDNITVKEIYTLDGIRLTTPRNGVNIMRMSDGSVRKVYHRD